MSTLDSREIMAHNAITRYTVRVGFDSLMFSGRTATTNFSGIFSSITW